VSGTIASPALSHGLAALLRGEAVLWNALGVTAAEFLEACSEQDLVGLLDKQLGNLPEDRDWPPDIREGLARKARAEAARELLRHREIIVVLEALAGEGVHPILLKGTPFAYQVYEAPHLRPRCDTDLLVPRAQIEMVRRSLAPRGYCAPLYCDGELLFCQFELAKEDEFGVDHVFDFHWKISTQSMFADLLTYDELSAAAVPVPTLGSHARTAGLVHALLLACLHPVMHHRNIERLIWIYDIHLLASGLSAAEFGRFVDLAVAKQVATISARGLALAHARFATRIPDRVTSHLLAVRYAEPSASYLQPARRWNDELMSSMRGLPRWTERVRLLREVVFPGPSYMLKAYGLRPGWASAVFLPALYFHRGVCGLVKVVAGRK